MLLLLFALPSLGYTKICLPLKHLPSKLDQKHRLARPHLLDGTRRSSPGRSITALGLAPRRSSLAPDTVSSDASREPGAVTHALDHARDVGGAVELGHLAGDADVGVDQGLVVDDHVLVGRVRVARALDLVRLPPEEVRPQLDLDEVQQGYDVAGPGLLPGRLTVEEEVEELEAYWVALDVESLYGEFWLAGWFHWGGRRGSWRVVGWARRIWWSTYLFSRSWIPVTLRCA